MKKVIISISIITLVCIGMFCIFKMDNKNEPSNNISEDESNKIVNLLYGIDINSNGVDDSIDIIEAARDEVDNEVTYKSTYYMGGYPPKDEGVCTDVIWRALDNAGINLKDEMDKDIKNNIKDYSAGISKADPNIDFRRVKNQHVFFKKYYINLTTEVNPNDESNLKEWQPGDIVVKNSNEHIAIISDKRNKDGVPFVLHNFYNHASEDDYLYDWAKDGKIVGHYRLNYEQYK